MNSEELLAHYQLRKTPVRKEVLAVFLTHRQAAISTQDIEQECRHIDRVTLYRTLKSFEQRGLIHRAIDGSETLKYALCHGGCNEHQHFDEHAHFHCDDCGKTLCLDQVAPPPLQLPTALKVRSAHLIVNGICEECNH